MNRAVAFQRRFDERLVEEVVPAPHGRALLTPSLPRVYYANHFAVDLGSEVSAGELVDELEPLFWAAWLGHRKVSVDDELGARLAPEFRELGWRVEELVVMPHTGAVRDVDTSMVEEVAAADLEPIWEAGIRSDPEIKDDEEVRQLVGAQHRRRRAAEVRYFAARADGEIASYCELFSADGTGQIESVMTLESYRSRGLGTAVVSRALEDSLARHDLTFLVADTEDWPKDWYANLGFEPVGTIWDFVLRP